MKNLAGILTLLLTANLIWEVISPSPERAVANMCMALFIVALGIVDSREQKH